MNCPRDDQRKKYQQVLAAAQLYCTPETDWVTFFRQVLGVDGIVRRAFPNLNELSQFEKSEEYATIQRIVVKLREKRLGSEAETEPTRVITVRLPKSMHESLQVEAHDLRTSLNKLCISKLLQVVEQDMIPVERRERVEQRLEEHDDLRRQLRALEARLDAYATRDEWTGPSPSTNQARRAYAK